ncbi:MAG: hypothetical protein QXU18_10990 [Thermoplasmatales archaeon]
MTEDVKTQIHGKSVKDWGYEEVHEYERKISRDEGDKHIEKWISSMKENIHLKQVDIHENMAYVGASLLVSVARDLEESKITVIARADNKKMYEIRVMCVGDA